MQPNRHLLDHARNPADVATRAFAGALAASRGRLPEARPLGLPPAEARALLARYFPTAKRLLPEDAANDAAIGCPPLRTDEHEDLLQLLLSHRSDDSDETRWLASAVAAASLGNDHLWQDLGLADRQELSDLLRHHFGPLFAKNTGNMKWKRFFYKQLCDQAEVNLCKAPSCRVCADYKLCFGPE